MDSICLQKIDFELLFHYFVIFVHPSYKQDNDLSPKSTAQIKLIKGLFIYSDTLE